MSQRTPDADVFSDGIANCSTFLEFKTDGTVTMITPPKEMCDIDPKVEMTVRKVHKLMQLITSGG